MHLAQPQAQRHLFLLPLGHRSGSGLGDDAREPAERWASAAPVIAAYLGRIGALRVLLAALLVVLIAMAPFAGARVEDSTWSIMASLIAPALVPIVFLVALFDVVMARVTMSAGDRRQRYRTVLWTYGVLLCALALAWAPFYARLF